MYKRQVRCIDCSVCDSTTVSNCLSSNSARPSSRFCWITSTPRRTQAIDVYKRQPLHYGDTAGLPLKLIWAALDLVMIVILGSGLYLWRRRARP